jgi:hypothetical protein
MDIFIAVWFSMIHVRVAVALVCALEFYVCLIVLI